jgi:hypothetical protein
MKKQRKTYRVNEDDILKISKLFGCLEETINEIIRYRVPKKDIGPCEMYFYEMTSRALTEMDPDPCIRAHGNNANF